MSVHWQGWDPKSEFVRNDGCKCSWTSSSQSRGGPFSFYLAVIIDIICNCQKGFKFGCAGGVENVGGPGFAWVAPPASGLAVDIM